MPATYNTSISIEEEESAEVIKPLHTVPEHDSHEVKSVNFSSLCWLLTHVAKIALCELFDSIHPPSRLDKTMAHSSVSSLLKQLREKGIIDDLMWYKLYPKASKTPTPVRSTDFDLSLLLILLKSVCHLAPPYPNGWSGDPLESDHSLAADLVRIDNFRDLIQSQQMALLGADNSTAFRNYWDNTTEVLNRLGGLKTRNALRLGEKAANDVKTRRQSVDLFNQWCNQTNKARKFSVQLDHFVRVNETQSFQATKVKSSILGQNPKMKSQTVQLTKEEEEAIERDILQTHRKMLCDSVQSEDIVTRLVQRGVLSHEDKNRVCLSRRNNERMALLLDHIEKKSGKSFSIFCDVLKFGYKSIHDQLLHARMAPLALLQQDPTILLEKAIRHHYSSTVVRALPWKWLLSNDDLYLNSLYIQPYITSAYGKVFEPHNLFRQHERCYNPRKVLVKGVSGSGKSELCRYVLQTWLANKWPNESHPVKLLFYIDLTLVEPNGRLIDEIRKQCLPYTYAAKDEDIEYMLNENKEHVLIIIDGYKQTIVKSEFDELISGSSYLEDCRLLVTTPSDWDITSSTLKLFETKLLLHGLLPNQRDNLIQLYAQVANAPPEFLAAMDSALLTNIEVSDSLSLNPFLCLCLCYTVHFSIQPAQTFIPPKICVAADILNHFVMVKVTRHVERQLITDSERINKAIQSDIVTMGKTALDMAMTGTSTVFAKNLVRDKDEQIILLEENGSVKSDYLSFPTNALQWFLAAKFLLSDASRELMEEHLNTLTNQYRKYHSLLVSFVSQCKQKDINDMIFNQLIEQCEKSIEHLVKKEPPIDINSNKLHENGKYSSSSEQSKDAYRHEVAKLVNNNRRIFSTLAPLLELLHVSSEGKRFSERISAMFSGKLAIKSHDIHNPASVAGLGMCLSEESNAVTDVVVTLDFLGNFYDDTIHRLANGIAQSKMVTTLTLNFTSAALLARFLATCFSSESSAIKELFLVDEGAKPDDFVSASMWTDLKKAATKMSKVDKIGLFNCKNPNLVSFFIESMPAEIRDVHIKNCALNLKAIRQIGLLVEKSSKLNMLSLSGSHIGQIDFNHLVLGLKLAKTLRILDISQTNVEVASLLSLVEALEFNTSLTHLNISHTVLPTSVCLKMSHYLQNSSLKQITLNKCKILQVDFQHFTEEFGSKIRFIGIPAFS